jgi:hypothetical protein
MILYQKLYDIDKNSHKTISKSLNPVFKFKKRNREEQVKNEIKSLAQENLFILKKILNKNSEYSAKKYEEQYKQSQRYKKMLCHYNSIDFATSKNNNEPIVQTCNFCSIFSSIISSINNCTITRKIVLIKRNRFNFSNRCWNIYRC